MTPEAQRKYALWAKYKMTLDDYDRMVESQGGMCFLCDADDPQTPHGFWHVDHNHATGVVRKLLCSPCNLALGLFRDSPEVLRRAADYVESEGL